MLSLFGFGPLIYFSVLLLNSIAILSEDRFLARSTYPPTILSSPFHGPGTTCYPASLLQRWTGDDTVRVENTVANIPSNSRLGPRPPPAVRALIRAVERSGQSEESGGESD